MKSMYDGAESEKAQTSTFEWQNALKQILDFFLMNCGAPTWLGVAPSWWGLVPLVVKSHEYFTPNIDIWALIDKQKNLWGDSPFKITLFCTDIDAENWPRFIHMPPVQKLCTTFYGTSFIGFLSWIPKTQFISAKQKTQVLQFFHVVQFFNNFLLHLMQYLYFLLFYTTKVL